MRIYDHTGKKYGTWTITAMFHDQGKKKYRCVCDHGHERITNSRHVTRIVRCERCMPILRNNARIGEKNGSLTCLGYIKTNAGRPGLLVQCDCGSKLIMQKYSQFKNTTKCQDCRHGFFPGRTIKGSTLIKRIEGRCWEKKCICGTIFIADSRRTDCGCIYKDELLKLAHKKIGSKYFFLTVKKVLPKQNRHIRLLIKCVCGKEFIRDNGHEFKSMSCGCKFQVPFGEKSANATLKNSEVLSIRELYASNMYTLDQLAKMFNKTPNYIYRIIKRNIWKHI